MKRVLIITVLLVAGASYAAVTWLGARAEEKNSAFRREFSSTAARIDSEFRHRETTVKGIKWHYVEQGPADGPVILFLHGLPECWYSWHYVMPLIDSNYRQIVLDMKGYGRSDKQDDDYNWHVVARQISELMDGLEINRFFVVGHDWGSLIGSVLVSDYPNRILGFVRMQADLIRSSLIRSLVRKPQFLLFQLNWLGTLFMEDAAWFIDRVYPPRMATDFKPVDRDYLVNEFARDGVAQQVPKYFKLKNWDLDAAMTKICKEAFPFPVLILQADKDASQPVSLFESVSSECPRVELRWISDASHFSNFDKPEEVARAINDFLSRARLQR
jgi:pimeloyl-ACP methyl ester carboxylesterase